MIKTLQLFVLLILPSLCLASPELKIGFILPLSGPVSEYGVAAQNGVILAREEHPDLFKNIEFIFDDSRYDSKTTLSIFENFGTAKQVSLAYVWGYSPNQALAPVAESKGFPIISTSSEKSVAIGKKFVTRFAYDVQQASEALLRYTRSKNYRSIGIVKTDIAFHNGLIDAMQSSLQPLEHLEVVESYGLDAQDFKSTILKLRTKTFDVLGIFLLEGQVSQFYRQAEQLSYSPKTILTDLMESPQEIIRSGSSINGAVFAAHFTSPEFIEGYQSRFKTDYQIPYAANAYEFAVLAAELSKSFATTPTPTMWVDALRSIKNRTGVIGNYSFDESTSSFKLPVVLKQIQDGKIITLAE